MTFKTKGIVIKQIQVGEKDKIIVLITDNMGKISVSAKGSKGIKSKLLSSCELFAYSEFTLYKYKDRYILNDANHIEMFYDIRKDIINMSLGGYFLDVLNGLCETEKDTSRYLSLVLNALYLLTGNKKSNSLIKAIFELRALCYSGYMPNLVCCRECEKFTDDKMFFSVENGDLICSDCNKEYDEKLIPINNSILSALRHITYSEDKSLFSFKLNENNEKRLEYICENFLFCQLDVYYKTLEFYKKLIYM